MSIYSDAWQALEAHHADTQHVTLRERFAADAERFNNMHEILHGLLFDYSKNRLDENTLIIVPTGRSSRFATIYAGHDQR